MSILFKQACQMQIIAYGTAGGANKRKKIAAQFGREIRMTKAVIRFIKSEKSKPRPSSQSGDR